MTDEDKQPFLGHLEELRKRLVACAIAIGVGFAVSYAFSERLFNLLILPLKAVMPKAINSFSPTCLRCSLLI